MKTNLPLPKDKKLNVICRVESGCLGPDGEDKIDKFCKHAQKEFETVDSDFIHWEIIPRSNKSLPEMQYNVNGKKLSHDKAVKYLEVFEKSLDEFEIHLEEKLALLINEYLDY